MAGIQRDQLGQIVMMVGIQMADIQISVAFRSLLYLYHNFDEHYS